MIRPLEDKDAPDLERMHFDSELPPNCKPDLADPLFILKAVVEREGKVVMASLLRGTAEVYLLVDHEWSTPEERWLWLQELRNYMVQKAYELGLDQMTAWVPPGIDKGFRKRLEALGFVKSPWQSYTLSFP